MKKYLKDLFTQQFGSFLIKQGYTENKNSFVKFYDDIFARVYLTYHYDKNYDELQFDVIHSFTPLIFEIGTKCICDGEDDFSLSRLSGEEYIADATDKSDVTNCISRMFSKYSELYESFFSAKSISEYLDKYLIYDKSVCSGKEEIGETYNFLGLDFIYIYLYLKEYNSAENEIEKYLKMLKWRYEWFKIPHRSIMTESGNMKQTYHILKILKMQFYLIMSMYWKLKQIKWKTI